MKKFLNLFALIVVFAFVVSACAPSVQGLAQMPEEGRLLIIALVTAGVTWLLLQAAMLLKIDLTGYVAPIVAIVSPILITLIESWLQLIPPIYDEMVLTVIHFVVLLFSSLGVLTITRRNVKKTLIG